jgi:outer membrane protein assembly factor BamB
MLGAFPLFMIAALSGMVATFVLCRERRIYGGQDEMHTLIHTERVRGKLPTTSRNQLQAWSGTCALLTLLIVLAGCSPFSSNSGAPAKPITPLTLPTRTATPTDSTASSADWTTYHRDNARTGYVANAADAHQLSPAWNMHLDGAVYAEPLVVKEQVIVATEGDSLYSLDARTGQVQWHTNIGSPVPLSTLPCGNIDPLGITGTPVYDPATNLVFAVAEVSGPEHILVGVNANTGQVQVRRVADPAGIETTPHQQRAALALSKGRVYIAYGGLDGDCGNYHGWVVASRTDGQGPLLSYQVPTTREGGIWAPSGPAIDSNGRLFVPVGNGEATQGDWDHTDSVLRLSPTLQLEDGFAPTQWQQDNATDADLGSMGPVLLPGGWVYAGGKSGFGYLLRADALGGIGGQAQVISICSSYGGAASIGSQMFLPCTDGLRQVLLGPDHRLTQGWHAPGQVSGSPIVGGHTVYSLDRNGTLYALNSQTGTVITTISVGSTSRFATPTLFGDHVFVGTMTGVVAVTIS